MRRSSSKISILQMIGHLHMGGAEQVVVNLSNGLDRSVFDLTLMARQDGFLACKFWDRSRIVILPKRNGFDPAHLWALVRLVKSRNIQVIHSHLFGPNFFGLLTAKLTGAKIIGTIHGRDCFSRKTRIIYYRNMARYYDYIVTVSDLLEEELRGYIKGSGRNMKTIYNGIPTDSFCSKVDKNAVLRYLGLPPDKKIIGAVGNIRPIKGQDVLIKSLFHLRQNGMEDALLLIIGDVFPKYKEYKIALDQLCKEFNLQDKVVFLGFRENVAEILPIFDVYVLPSRSEGLSLSLLEAMASKRPIIATDVGMNSHIIKNNINGLIVPNEQAKALSEAMYRILCNPDYGRAMGQNAFQDVQDRYSIAAMTRQYASLYESLRN